MGNRYNEAKADGHSVKWKVERASSLVHRELASASKMHALFVAADPIHNQLPLELNRTRTIILKASLKDG